MSRRLARYSDFKKFKSRIMVATDIFGRGIDIDHVNIVINYDMPVDTDTYLHRVCGRGLSCVGGKGGQVRHKGTSHQLRVIGGRPEDPYRRPVQVRSVDPNTP